MKILTFTSACLIPAKSFAIVLGLIRDTSRRRRLSRGSTFTTTNSPSFVGVAFILVFARNTRREVATANFVPSSAFALVDRLSRDTTC